MTSERGIGDNGPAPVEGGQLRAFVERAERLETEKAEIAADLKELFSEARGVGFDTKIIRKILAIRKGDPNKRAEEEALIETYKSALGMA